MAHTLRATDNRFRERTQQCFFSLVSYAFGLSKLARSMAMNTTAHNQGDHCILALSNAPVTGLPVVDDGNLVLHHAPCPSRQQPGAVSGHLLLGLAATVYNQHQASLESLDKGAAARFGVASALDATYKLNAANYYGRGEELKRMESRYGDQDPRVVEARQRLRRYGATIAQLGAQSELTLIKEAPVPEKGMVVDGRVADEGHRGREHAKVELLRADGRSLGIAGSTDGTGYFALALDEGRAKRLRAEKAVRLKVSDAKGNELYRSETPIAVEAGETIRADVVLARREIPLAVRARATVIFGERTRPPVDTSGSTPLERIKGIGPKTADKLRAAGIPDVETLLRTPGERLVEIAGFDAEGTRREAERVLKEGAGRAKPAPPPGKRAPRRRPRKE
jgi:predicted flap endonuclease-1-like 5' DNA nuclease